MKTIDLKEENLDLEDVIKYARKETVLLLTSDGREFIVSEMVSLKQ